MKKDDKFDNSGNWYELWMQQSKEFFSTADDNLKNLFGQHNYVNPEEHMQQIQAWLDTLKNQWQFLQLSEQQRIYENYWKNMTKMSNEAIDMMLHEWIKRTKENNPVKNTRELYELWLECCNNIYHKAIHSKSYQETYGELMNAALKYWKSAIPR